MSAPMSFRELSGPVAALALLMAGHSDLPAPDIQISPVHPERLRLAFHNKQFDTWLTALGINPETVTAHTQSDGATNVRKTTTTYGGADIELLEFTHPAVGPDAEGGDVQ